MLYIYWNLLSQIYKLVLNVITTHWFAIRNKCLPWNDELFLLECQQLQLPTGVELLLPTTLFVAWPQFNLVKFLWNINTHINISQLLCLCYLQEFHNYKMRLMTKWKWETSSCQINKILRDIFYKTVYLLLSTVIYVCNNSSKWVDNITVNLRETGWCSMDWIDLAQDKDQWRAIVNMLMNFWVP
jgi:hypothetical protein